MFTMFTHLVQWPQSKLGRFCGERDGGRSTQPNVANQLMESAEACAGTNPYQAAELRRAAQQFLSVVR